MEKKKEKLIKKISKKNTNKGNKILLELESIKAQLLQAKEESKQKDAEIEKLKNSIGIKLGTKPKYGNQKNCKLRPEMLDEVSSLVRNGIFMNIQLADFLGINRNTFQSWIQEGNSDKLEPDDIRVQLVKVIEYSKQIFFLANQTVINKFAQSDSKDARWNLESRFPHLRTNATNNKNIVNINDSQKVISDKMDEKSQRLLKVTKEISFMIDQSVDDDEFEENDIQ